MKTGLVSITFRQLSAAELVRLVADAGLDGIEWGGDVHVPHGDLNTARHVAGLTRDAGLETAVYGAYYRAGEPEGTDMNPAFQSVLDSARILDAPTIRVWAGECGSADADAACRARVVADLVRIDRMATAVDIEIALEFHGGTLTDTTESTRALMKDLAGTQVKFYWQPPLGGMPEDGKAQIRMLAPRLSNLHVFAWDATGDGIDRRALQEHAMVWREYFAAVREAAGDDRWALLEFVKNDDPEQFKADAVTIKDLATTGLA